MEGTGRSLMVNAKPELAFCHLPLSVLDGGRPVLSVAVLGNTDASANRDPSQRMRVTLKHLFQYCPADPTSLTELRSGLHPLSEIRNPETSQRNRTQLRQAGLPDPSSARTTDFDRTGLSR